MIIQNLPYQIYSANQAPSFKSKTGVVCKALKNNTNNLNTIGVGVAGIIGGLLARKEKEQTNLFESCMQLKDSNNFDNYKKHLLKFLKQNGYNEDFINDIQAIEDIQELKTEFDIFIDSTLLNDDLLHDEELDITNKIKKKDYSPELNRLILDCEIKKADLAVPIAKLFSETDTDSEVLEIKEELKTKYKQNNLFFNNDINVAEHCKEAFEILDKNNIPFNGTIISIDYFEAAGINLASSNGPCIIINPNNWQIDENSITKVILHEILHSLQPQTLEFRTQTIPEKYNDTVTKISSYAEGNYAHEVHCELYVKKLTKGLTKDEEELFNYLGGTFLE